MALLRRLLKEGVINWEVSSFCSVFLPIAWKVALMAGAPAAILNHEMTLRMEVTG